MTHTEVIILSAGHGTRMRSSKPKSLQQIGARPMLHYIVECAKSVNFDRVHVVIGKDGDEIRSAFESEDINWVIQTQQLGTADAVKHAIPAIDSESTVCVLYGDNPFIDPKTMHKMIDLTNNNALSVLTAKLENPKGYGRIKRTKDGKVSGIVEDKDASEDERRITEVNAGPLCAQVKTLQTLLEKIDNNNQQNEYYLTDIVGAAFTNGIDIKTCATANAAEIAGVNSRNEQARLERKLQLKNAAELMQAGVEISDPARFDLRGSCSSGKDCRIDINVIIEGDVRLDDRVSIGANCIVRDSVLEADVTILPNTIVEGAQIHTGATVGPFARIRPGTVIGADCKIGNFVEIKNSTLGSKTKVSHLAYVGDCDTGEQVNIGAGTITCNYDGSAKHRTHIGDKAFIGSNVSLVAPLDIGDGAVIGAGSTITRDVPSGKLAVERSQTKTMPAERFRR